MTNDEINTTLNKVVLDWLKVFNDEDPEESVRVSFVMEILQDIQESIDTCFNN